MAGRKTAQQEEKRKRVFHNAPPTYFDADEAVAFYNRRAEAIKRASPRPDCRRSQSRLRGQISKAMAPSRRSSVA